jgi:hypothetical protein
MSFGTWIGKVLALGLVVAIDIALAFAALYWLGLSEFWVLFILIATNTSTIMIRMK